MHRSHCCFCVLCAALGLALALWLLLAGVPSLEAAAPAPPAKPAPVSFINEIAPILKESCFGCHGARNPKGKLDMTHYATLRKGGTKEDPLVAGHPDDSLLVTLISATNKSRMPPLDSGDALPKEQVALIERWIAEGAKLDTGITPEADLLRELRVRWQPPAPPAAYPFPVAVTALAFSPDGKKLVASGHHELTVWDVDSGKLEKRIRTRARRAMAMLFLSDGKLAVGGGRPGEEGEVRIFDINGGTPKVVGGVAELDGVNDGKVMLKHLLDTDDEVLCLALSADGKKLACGGCDRLIHVWDLAGGYAAAQALPAIENHADWVFSVVFTPDGKRVVSGSRDKTAKVWDLAARESVLTFPEHQQSVYGVEVSPDGKLGFSAGEDNQIRVWNIASETKQVRNSGGHGAAILRMLRHPKKPLLITCSADHSVRIWNADNGGEVKNLGGHNDYVFAVALSPDGTRLASGGFDGEVRLWSVDDGKLIRSFNASPGLPAAPAGAARK